MTGRIHRRVSSSRDEGGFFLSVRSMGSGQVRYLFWPPRSRNAFSLKQDLSAGNPNSHQYRDESVCKQKGDRYDNYVQYGGKTVQVCGVKSAWTLVPDLHRHNTSRKTSVLRDQLRRTRSICKKKKSEKPHQLVRVSNAKFAEVQRCTKET